MLKNVTSVVEKDDTINMFKILIFLILCHFSVNIPPIGPRLMYRGRTCVSLARTHRQISFFHFFPPGKQFQGSLHCHFYQVKKMELHDLNISYSCQYIASRFLSWSYFGKLVCNFLSAVYQKVCQWFISQMFTTVCYTFCNYFWQHFKIVLPNIWRLCQNKMLIQMFVLSQGASQVCA